MDGVADSIDRLAITPKWKWYPIRPIRGAPALVRDCDNEQPGLFDDVHERVRESIEHLRPDAVFDAGAIFGYRSMDPLAAFTSGKTDRLVQRRFCRSTSRLPRAPGQPLRETATSFTRSRF
jgi:hypothetical protein